MLWRPGPHGDVGAPVMGFQRDLHRIWGRGGVGVPCATSGCTHGFGFARGHCLHGTSQATAEGGGGVSVRKSATVVLCAPLPLGVPLLTKGGG